MEPAPHKTSILGLLIAFFVLLVMVIIVAAYIWYGMQNTPASQREALERETLEQAEGVDTDEEITPESLTVDEQLELLDTLRASTTESTDGVPVAPATEAEQLVQLQSLRSLPEPGAADDRDRLSDTRAPDYVEPDSVGSEVRTDLQNFSDNPEAEEYVVPESATGSVETEPVSETDDGEYVLPD